MMATIILVITFLSGAIVGIMMLLRLGIAQDEGSRSLTDPPPTRVAAATRRMLGLHYKDPMPRPGDTSAMIAQHANQVGFESSQMSDRTSLGS